jgi:PIN domain
MPFVVVYDACVLYPAPLRDLLVRLGRTGLCQVKWTRQILDECFRNLSAQRPDLEPERLLRSRELLEQSILDVQVTGHEGLIEGLTGLPDPDDRHVLAAAHPLRCPGHRDLQPQGLSQG